MNLAEYMKKIRRDIHANPELSLEERETCDYIVQRLQKTGLKPVTVGETGVYADLIISEELPYLLFRADIDALPVEEKNETEYKSCKPGIMHACGHDGHIAMLLGAAKRLNENRQGILFNIRFVFQPAEELFGGAKQMIDEGIIPVDTVAAFAFHLWPQLPHGVVGIKYGSLMASNDHFIIRIEGASAHCAMRHEGKDALLAGVSIVDGLNAIQSQLHPERPALIFVGNIHSGNAYNIVSRDCVIEGTVRAMAEEDRKTIEEAIRVLARCEEIKKSVRIHVEYMRKYPPMINDSGIIDKCKKNLQNTQVLNSPYMTAEDFAFFAEARRSAMFLLGTRSEKYSFPLHSDRFDFEEDILSVGCKLYCDIARINWSEN